MRYIRRTVFNVWLQPQRVGKRITKAKYCFVNWFKYIKRTQMQKQRRAKQGSFNVRYNRYIALTVNVKFFIKPNKTRKVAPSFMRRKL